VGPQVGFGRSGFASAVFGRLLDLAKRLAPPIFLIADDSEFRHRPASYHFTTTGFRMEADERGSNWRTISSRSIHRDQWIHLRADDCLTPRGQEIAPYYVLEFRHFVHVIAIEETGKLVMVRQYRHGVESNSLELPGGVVDEEESEARETAARELSEETGYVKWTPCVGPRGLGLKV